MKFAYMPLPVRQSARTRYRPIVPIHILAPRMLPPMDACIDSAAVSIFPMRVRRRDGLAEEVPAECPWPLDQMDQLLAAEVLER